MRTSVVFGALLPLCALLISSVVIAQEYSSDGALSAIAMRQLQSRSFNTTDQQKLENVIEDVMADLGYQKSSRAENRYGKMLKCRKSVPGVKGGFLVPEIKIPDMELPCPLIIDVIRRSSETAITLRFQISQDGRTITDRAVFEELFSGISKGLFLEANPLPAQELN